MRRACKGTPSEGEVAPLDGAGTARVDADADAAFSRCGWGGIGTIEGAVDFRSEVLPGGLERAAGSGVCCAEDEADADSDARSPPAVIVESMVSRFSEGNVAAAEAGSLFESAAASAFEAAERAGRGTRALDAIGTCCAALFVWSLASVCSFSFDSCACTTGVELADAPEEPELGGESGDIARRDRRPPGGRGRVSSPGGCDVVA